jgi:hypothetical protein
MQLDAFLRSAKRYAPYESITVLWDGTSLAHIKSYDDTPAADAWWFEGKHEGGDYLSFGARVRQFLMQYERVVFHTDDDVFFAAPRDSWLGACDSNPQWVPSLRLGRNTTYCHPLDREQSHPVGDLWRWREAEYDFGYPLCLNGTVYRSADLLPLLDFPFANPTELEAGLDYRRELFRPEWMTAPLHSCCVSLPHNRVSSSSGCPAGSNPEWQPDALLAKYLDGWRIDLDSMDFSNITSAHQEVPLAFTR